MKNKTRHTFWNIWNLVLSVLFIGLGIVTCAFAGNTDFQNTIILIIGIFLVAIAGLQIVAQVFRIILVGNKTTIKTDLSIATVTASELALGIVTIMVAYNQEEFRILFRYLGYFIGILMISIGLIVIIYEVVFIVRKIHGVTYSVLIMIAALLPILLGVLFIIFLSDQAHLLTLILVCGGIALILLGLCYMTFIIIKIRAERFINDVMDEVEEAAAQSSPYIDVTVEEHVVVDEPKE